MKFFWPFLQQAAICHKLYHPLRGRVYSNLTKITSSRSMTSSSDTFFASEVLAREIFHAGVDAISPVSMVTDALKVVDNKLIIGQRRYDLKSNVYIVAFGKAVTGMVRASEDILGEHVVRGVASVPYGIEESLTRGGYSDFLPSKSSKVELIEGAKNNLPDEDAVRAALAVSDLVEDLTKTDILLVLISGGGSALLPSPIPPVTLNEKQLITKQLASRGASIQELNTVRKQLSTLKGGKLAQLAKPSQVVSLILSDIIGDPIDLIASGPTVPDSSTASDCKGILNKYLQENEMPQSVLQVLSQKEHSLDSNNIKDFNHVQNVLVGSNTIAVNGAVKKAREHNLIPIVLSTCISGDASHVGEAYAKLAHDLSKLFFSNDKSDTNLLSLVEESLKYFGTGNCEETLFQIKNALDKRTPLCIIGAGETTVTLKGNGKGGRNQEMALAAAVAMDKLLSNQSNSCEVVFLCAGTDGQDGPTDAAGAISYPGLVHEARVLTLDPQVALDNNDSYSFYSDFKNGQFLLKTGLTGTNVMDMQILIIKH